MTTALALQPLLKQLSFRGKEHDSYDPNGGGKGTYTISAQLPGL